MQTQQLTGQVGRMLPMGQLRRFVGGQALEAAPGIPHAEQAERAHEGVGRRCVAALHDHAHQGGRAVEVTPPQVVSDRTGQGRI